MSIETTSIKVTIPMEPVAKGRPKFTKRGFAYTPAKTKDAEKFIRAFVSGYPKFATGLPLAMSIDFYLSKPKSVGKKREFPTTRPDIDNYCKLILDSLNGVLFHDDGQIIRLLARKEYGSPSRIEISIEEVK